MENIIAQDQSPLNQKITGILKRYPVILQLLRFVAIGVINTALDFLVLNISSKTLHISLGYALGFVNVVGFILAVTQSFFWNKYWAFGAQEGVSVLKNFIRLCLVGVLGAAAMGLVLIGAKIIAPAGFYAMALAVFLIFEFVLWFYFGFLKIHISVSQKELWLFIIISLVGLLINSSLIAVITNQWQLSGNLDLNKNIAKILATLVSLIWNFAGYKLIVFKK